MFTMLSEEEQLIVIKAWWHKYRYFVIIGLALGIGIFFAWRTWQDQIAEAQVAASIGYQGVLENLADNNYKVAAESLTVQTQQQQVMPYELMNQLIFARIESMENKPDEAIKSLQWVIEKTEDDRYFYDLASVRLAKIYLDQNKPEEALKVLNTAEDKKYPDWFLVKADAQVQLKRYAEARENYNKALALYTPYSFQGQIINMQIADLPE